MVRFLRLAPWPERPGDVVDASVGTVGGAADRDHHRLDSPAVVASADDLAENLLGEGGVLRRVDLQGDVIGVDFGVAGRELLEQLIPLLGIELPADDAVAFARPGGRFLGRRSHGAFKARDAERVPGWGVQPAKESQYGRREAGPSLGRRGDRGASGGKPARARRSARARHRSAARGALIYPFSPVPPARFRPMATQ